MIARSGNQKLHAFRRQIEGQTKEQIRKQLSDGMSKESKFPRKLNQDSVTMQYGSSAP
jgi:hypothetical protein